MNMEGHVDVDSRSDLSCGAKEGTWSTGATSLGGSANVYGADGNNTPNQSIGPGATDVKQFVSDSMVTPFILKSGDLDSLKAIAKASGTYFSGPAVQGLTFGSGNQMPNGVIYVDTVSGQNIDANGPNTTSASDFASVTVQNSAAADPSGTFSGMIVVAGSLNVTGTARVRGIVYAATSLTYSAPGNSQIDGAVISRNIRDTSTTTIYPSGGGTAAINFNCGYVANPGGQMPQTFTIQPGSYREVSGS
jgi:hypothetical protein